MGDKTIDGKRLWDKGAQQGIWELRYSRSLDTV